MTALLRVEPVQFVAASRTIGETVAERVLTGLWQLVDDLEATTGMAGSDPAAQGWAGGYDDVAHALVSAAEDTVRACFRLAALLQQSGLNYGRAETASAGGEIVLDRNDYADRVVYCSPPPGAAGDDAGNAGAPPGWALIEHAIRYVWPNGHQDRLHAAATAWRSFAAGLGCAADDVPAAVAAIDTQQVPELDSALAACATVRAAIEQLASTGREVARDCEEYAHHLDQAHSEIEHELVSLLEWTVAIETVGAGGAVFTFGASEAAAQAAETSRIAATAVRIAEIIEKVAALARGAGVYLANLGYDLARIIRELNPLLTSRTVVAVIEQSRGGGAAHVAGVGIDGSDGSVIGSAVTARVGSAIGRSSLSREQLSNLQRFLRRLPAAAEDSEVIRAADGSVQFASRVPGRVPGSYAIYTKVVDATGATTRYFKTTVAPDGTIVHMKVKYP